MNKFTTFFFFSLLSFFAFVTAFPVNVVRDVFVPPVITPNASTVWVVGQNYNVTWNTTDAPVNITNKYGMVVLAKDGVMIDLDQPLASNFSILLGSIEVTCPNVTAGDDYAIVLFGDSGNDSPTFTITN